MFSCDTSSPKPAAGDQQRHHEHPRPLVALGARHDGDDERHADERESEPRADEDRGTTAADPPARDQRDEEHAHRQRGDREPGFERVVAERDLKKDRDDDHRSAERDLLQHLLRDADPEVRRGEQGRVDQHGLAVPLASDEPPRERAQPHDADREQREDRLAALLPDQDAEDDAAHADDGQAGTDPVDAAVARVRDVLHQAEPRARRR